MYRPSSHRCSPAAAIGGANRERKYVHNARGKRLAEGVLSTFAAQCCLSITRMARSLVPTNSGKPSRKQRIPFSLKQRPRAAYTTRSFVTEIIGCAKPLVERSCHLLCSTYEESATSSTKMTFVSPNERPNLATIFPSIQLIPADPASELVLKPAYVNISLRSWAKFNASDAPTVRIFMGIFSMCSVKSLKFFICSAVILGACSLASSSSFALRSPSISMFEMRYETPKASISIPNPTTTAHPHLCVNHSGKWYRLPNNSPMQPAKITMMLNSSKPTQNGSQDEEEKTDDDEIMRFNDFRPTALW